MTPHPYSDKKINKINNKIFQHCRSEPLNLGHTLVQDPTYALRFNPFTWELNVPIHIVCQKAPHRAFNLHIGFPKPYIKLRDACIAAKWLLLCQQWDICFYLFIVLYDSIWWGNSEWIGIHILCETICFPPWCIGGVVVVKSILSSINVSTLRPPEGAGDGFFVVPSSDRRPAAIWLILVHEFTSESLHGFPDHRPQVRNISSGVQSLSSGSTLTWAPNLIGYTRSIF